MSLCVYMNYIFKYIYPVPCPAHSIEFHFVSGSLAIIKEALLMLAFDLKRGVDLRKVFPNLFQAPPILNRGLIKEKYFLRVDFFSLDEIISDKLLFKLL